MAGSLLILLARAEQLTCAGERKAPRSEMQALATWRHAGRLTDTRAADVRPQPGGGGDTPSHGQPVQLSSS